MWSANRIALKMATLDNLDYLELTTNRAVIWVCKSFKVFCPKEADYSNQYFSQALQPNDFFSPAALLGFLSNEFIVRTAEPLRVNFSSYQE